MHVGSFPIRRTGLEDLHKFIALRRTFGGDVLDMLARLLAHVPEHGEDDEPGEEARRAVDGTRRERVAANVTADVNTETRR